MRMANDRDQAIVRAAVSDAAGSLLGFLPSLGSREVFAFGEGVALPTRMRFRELAEVQIPRSEAVGRSRMKTAPAADPDYIASIVERWRGAMVSSKQQTDDLGSDFDDFATEEFSALQQSPARSGEPAPDRNAEVPVGPNGSLMRPDSFFFPINNGRPKLNK